jgi:RNA-directed DNA polymerase
LKRERDKLQMTDARQCFNPILQLIEEVNRHLKGWANYFSIGYPRVALREINAYMRDRLVQHPRRR